MINDISIEKLKYENLLMVIINACFLLVFFKYLMFWFVYFSFVCDWNLECHIQLNTWDNRISQLKKHDDKPRVKD